MRRRLDDTNRAPRARALLADTQALFLEGLRRLVEPTYEVVGTVAEEGRLVEETARLQPDLVTLEVRLATSSGLEAARRILTECPGTRAVFVTAVEDGATAAEAFAVGASAYVLKSASAPELLAALDTALRGGRFLSPRLAAGDPRALAPASLTSRRRRLTARAQEVVRLLARGHSMKEAGAALGITARTIGHHKYRAMRALNLHSSAELVRFAVETGIVGPSGPFVERASPRRGA